MVPSMGKSTRMISEVEEILTVKLRQNHPDIERIGIENGPAGWRCYRIWNIKSAPTASLDKMENLLAEANTMLGELQKHFAITK
jgi:hypothetical protein